VQIYIGIPMYGGAHGLAVRSLLSLQEELLLKGHEAEFDIVIGGSILPKVRNGIVKRFIDSRAEVLLMLDADMMYDTDTIMQLINAPFDASIVNYKAKNNFGRWHCTATGSGKWMKVQQGPAGIMAIKRQTITGMINHFPDLVYMDNGAETPCLFDFQLDNGHYYGEDYTFCKRMAQAGKELYLLADAFVGHIGETVYAGNYRNHLDQQG
jgi:hypothetical protein